MSRSYYMRWLVALTFVSVVSAWLVTGQVLSPMKDRGTWGDMYGGLNALFSGLAFVGVIYAILLQSEELKLQRRELAETRAELKGQRQASEEQNKSIGQQTFENTLFQFIEVLENAKKSLNRRSDDGNITSEGLDTLREIYSGMGASFRESIRRTSNSPEFRVNGKEPEPNLDLVFRSFYDDYGHEFNHYLRIIVSIFSLIDKSPTNSDRYADIVISQLSDYEVCLIFYMSLFERYERLKLYVDKYGIVVSVRPELLIKDEHLSLHAAAAFSPIAKVH